MDLSPENFERLMNWLHSDREEAGQEYQRIRAILVKHFQTHNRSVPDRLADVTIDRAAQTLSAEQITNWTGAKERYFFRVAYYILLEDRSDNVWEVQMPDGLKVSAPVPDVDLETRSRCLTKCLHGLSNSDRDLIVRYYQGTKAIKIKNRQELALERNLSLPLLRVRAHRLRTELKTCIERCFEQAAR
jgi:hypothetical protein